MKRFMLLAFAALVTASTYAQSIKIEKHSLNTQQYTSGMGSWSFGFTSFKGKTYFFSDDGLHGQELWVHEESELGKKIQMVGDINPGIDPIFWSQYEPNLIAAGGKLYFGANDGVHGNELWQYNGLNAPSMVADLTPGDNKSHTDPRWFTELGGKLYFVSQPLLGGHHIMEMDLQTQAIRQIPQSEPYMNGFGHLKTFNNKLYFTGNSGMHCYDPATDKTIKVNKGYIGKDPAYYTEYNGALYFEGFEQNYGRELFMYDGVNDPVRISDFSPGQGFGIAPAPVILNNPLYVYKGELYFSAANPTTSSHDLVKYNSSTKQLTTIANSMAAYHTIPYRDRIWFGADSGYNYQFAHLYNYDGTGKPAQYVPDTPFKIEEPIFMAESYGRIFFTARRNATHWDLYILTDPIALQTEEVFTGSQKLSVYPNPTTGDVTIEISNVVSTPVNITVRDMMGRIVQTKDLEAGTSGIQTLSLLSCAAGSYSIRIVNDFGELYSTVIQKQ